MLKAGFEKPRYCRVCGSARVKKRRKEGCMMKKIISVLVVLLLAAPAMGALSITCTQGDTGECIVSYSGADDDANRPRAFALDISLSDGAVVVSEPVGSYDAQYYIYPDSIIISGGKVTDWGTPVAAGGASSSTMTIAMGSLYATSDTKHTNPPPTFGELFRFTVDATTTVDITENAIRGKVVKENRGNYPSLDTSCVITAVGCPYDITADEWMTIDDVFYVLNLLEREGCVDYECEIGVVEMTPEEERLDATADGWITIDDLFYVLNMLEREECVDYECECPIE
jgi:hypothetical protein